VTFCREKGFLKRTLFGWVANAVRTCILASFLKVFDVMYLKLSILIALSPAENLLKLILLFGKLFMILLTHLTPVRFSI